MDEDIKVVWIPATLDSKCSYRIGFSDLSPLDEYVHASDFCENRVVDMDKLSKAIQVAKVKFSNKIAAIHSEAFSLEDIEEQMHK